MTTTDFIQIIGTAAFAVSGYLVGYSKRLDVLGVVITALLTAVGGGIARDILVNDVPVILSADLYGSVAILIGGLMYVFAHLGWINAVTLHLLFAAGLALRLAAYHFHWQLPGFQPRRK